MSVVNRAALSVYLAFMSLMVAAWWRMLTP